MSSNTSYRHLPFEIDSAVADINAEAAYSRGELVSTDGVGYTAYYTSHGKVGSEPSCRIRYQFASKGSDEVKVVYVGPSDGGGTPFTPTDGVFDIKAIANKIIEIVGVGVHPR